MYSKIQVIKMLRDQNPGLGLKEAKDIVDSYELKNFEDRVARALGEEARAELRSWAVTFVATRNRAFEAIVPEPSPQFFEDYEDENEDEDEDNVDFYGNCDCSDCQEYQEEPVKKASEIWCLDTGIRILDPDGWDRRNYEDSWYEPITREEFISRAYRSTCERWPDPLYDE